MGFTKLDSGIVLSSIWAQPEYIRVVWTTILALKNQNGFIATSYSGLQRTCNLLDDIEGKKFANSIAYLEGPDPDSRTKEFDGRRIQRIEGGWIVLNHQKYRDFLYSDHPDAIRQRKHREKGENVTSVTCHDPRDIDRDISVSVLLVRSTSFKEAVNKHNTIYSQSMLDDFIRYWTEPNKSGSKMRFELEQTWDLPRRLVTWAKNDKTFNKKSGAPEHDYQRAAAGKYSNLPKASNQ